MDEFVGANIDPESKESRTMLDELLFDPGLQVYIENVIKQEAA